MPEEWKSVLYYRFLTVHPWIIGLVNTVLHLLRDVRIIQSTHVCEKLIVAQVNTRMKVTHVKLLENQSHDINLWPVTFKRNAGLL